MRLNDKLSARASVLIINVLARPGTPSNRQWPRLNREISNSSITWSWPTITLANWAMILPRASPNLLIAAESSVLNACSVMGRFLVPDLFADVGRG